MALSRWASFVRELLLGAREHLAGQVAVANDDPVAEGDRCAGLQGEAGGLLFRIVALPTEGVGGKQAVSAGMPRSRSSVEPSGMFQSAVAESDPNTGDCVNAELIRTPAPAGGLESDVADIPSLQQKAVDFAKRGDFGADARALNEELTRLAPDNEGAWTRLARCCLEAGQLDAASGALESALLLNPQNNLARSLLQEVIRRELLAEPAAEPAAPRARKSRARKAAAGDEPA